MRDTTHTSTVTTINTIDKILHYLYKIQRNDVFAVQVGAMDGQSYDDIVAYINGFDWRGLYIEPVPEYFNKLSVYRNKPGDICEETAVTSVDGPIEMVMVDPAVIGTEGVHHGFSGMSSMYPIKNGFVSDADQRVLNDHGIPIFVNGMRLDTIFKKHNITKFDIFLCDAEGYDHMVFDQLDLDIYRPKIIRLEHINLTEEEQNNILAKFDKYGYVYEIMNMDYDAFPKELIDDYMKEQDISVDQVPEPALVLDTTEPQAEPRSTALHSITSLVEKYGTDKSLSGYTPVYEYLFSPIVRDVSSILEVGIGTIDARYPSSFLGIHVHNSHYTPGGSLRVWRDFFVNAQVYGIDIAHDCAITEDRISTFIFDSQDKKLCNQELKHLTFDIIIDDGLHTALAQITTMRNLFNRVRNGGYYIIEDIGGSPNPEQLSVEYADEYYGYLNKHTWYSGGNYVVIKKTFDGRGQVQYLSDFDSISDALSATKSSPIKITSDPVVEMTPVVSTKFPETAIDSSVTIVTGFWDISRVGRGRDHYLEHMSRILELPNNMCIFIPEELREFVWSKRSPKNTYVKIHELEDIKRDLGVFFDRMQSIRTDPNWRNITGEGGWLKSSPQAENEWYNPIVMSKMFMLHDASIWNPFASEQFVWLDAAITNTVYEKFLVDEKFFDKMVPHLTDMLFLCYPYDNGSEVHGFTRPELDTYAGEPVVRVGRGGLFGGTKEAIHEANDLYYNLMNRSLNDGVMGTEETLFAIMTYLKPELYRRYMLDGNGMIVKYVQDVLAGTAQLEPIPSNRTVIRRDKYDPRKYKTNKYILTFNFPDQLDALLCNHREVGWDNVNATYVIDNTIDPEVIAINKKICDAFGVHHIPLEGNTGINGGRYFAAKHFDESDADFYLFFEDDMFMHTSAQNNSFCRNGFRQYVDNLYDTIHTIMVREKFDFLKLSYTEVYMDNNIQVSWYNVPQAVRTAVWPLYDKLPPSGLDINAPRTKFNHIDVINGVSYISGDVYYANWPMIMSRAGNKKAFLTETWARPYEQTWMSYIFQQTMEGNIKPAVLLMSPVNHNRMHFYKDDERREN